MHRTIARFAGLLLLTMTSTEAWAWGQEGHSIIAEIAQRRLSAAAAAEVARAIGPGHSLASISSWADDERDALPQTAHWHFVDMPIDSDRYDPARDCREGPKGDCVVAELERLKKELCAPATAVRWVAVRFAVHLVGDIHQPLHTVLEQSGGNGIQVEVRMAGGKSCGGHACGVRHFHTNFHALWDTGLIQATAWSWGAYVDLLSADLARQAVDPGTGGPREWAEETHAAAQTVWHALPADRVVDDAYYRVARPILDRQLTLGGLRLARYLNESYAACTGR
jgi:hypothetical protein